MLLSTKDQGLGRRRRSYSHGSIYANKGAKISKLSLMSAATTQSSGSNGSNSTVTQESYNKKKKKSKKRKDDRMEPVGEAPAEEEEGKVDVFEFLVKDEDVFDEEPDQPSSSIHSDSGISMDDGSYQLGQAALKPFLPTLPEEQKLADETFKSDWKWPEVPKPAYEDRPPAFVDVRRDSGQYITEPYSTCYTPATPEQKVPPSLYDLVGDRDVLRQFTRTNKRILLHLQQDIHQLDFELTELDTVLAKDPEARQLLGRRMSWEWNQPHLLSARADILHRLQLRMETYYKQVLLTKKIDKLDKASDGDLQQLRQTLKGKCVEADALYTILDEGDGLDLRSGLSNDCVPIAITLFTAVIPLLLFKFLTGMLNRVLIVLMTSGLVLCAGPQLLATFDLPRASEQSFRLWIMVASCITVVMAFLD